MLNIIAKNPAGTTLDLLSNDKYQLVSATGLNPPVATINTSEMATADGSVFNMARMPQRNIVLTIQPLYSIESARDNLYKWFAPKQAVNLTIVTNSRNMKIDGYVESFECDMFANPEMVQVSIICPDPYMKGAAVDDVILPASINNPGDAPSGAVFKIQFTGSATALTITDLIQGVSHSFVMEDLEVQSGDIITIDTRVGHKSVTLKRGLTITSLMANVDLASEWIQLAPGANSLSIIASNGSAKVSYVPLFMGV